MLPVLQSIVSSVRTIGVAKERAAIMEYDGKLTREEAERVLTASREEP